MTWDNTRKKQFRAALQDVYRSYGELQIFVRDAIDQNLAEIVGQVGLIEAVFELVERAEAKGQLDRLYGAFCTENDHHEFAIGNVSQNSSPSSYPSPNNPSASPGFNNSSQQQGIIGNDQANITIQHQEINHYHGSPPALGKTPIARHQPPTGDRYVSPDGIEGVCQAAITNNGALLRLKAPHQMGKTELAVRLCTFAGTRDYDCVVIDFRAIEKSKLANLDQFWRWFCQTIADELDIDTPLDTHWNKELLGSNSSCEKYLQKAVLKQTDAALVLILENVDRLFEELAIAEEVFRLVRAFHEKARTSRPWRKLRQVLTYSTEPLAKLDFANTNYSPFNVGTEIELTSLSPDQVVQLAAQFGLVLSDPTIAQLMADFGGHPALIKQALERLSGNPNLPLAELYSEALRPTSSHLRTLDKQLSDCGLQAAMAQVAGAAEPIAIEQESAYALYRLGMVNWDRDRRRVLPRCRLYRDRFR